MPLPREDARRDTPSPARQYSFTSCPPDDGCDPDSNITQLPSPTESSAHAEAYTDGASRRAATPSTISTLAMLTPTSERSRSQEPASPNSADESATDKKQSDGKDQSTSPRNTAAGASITPSDSINKNAVSKPPMQKSLPNPSPQYLYLPKLDRERYIPTDLTTSFLRPGSRFEGTQNSESRIYNVQVEFKHVNLAEPSLCGYLRIQGLTDEHPTLTTFFEAEIIGPKYSFETKHKSWGSTKKIDQTHWSWFPSWPPVSETLPPDMTFPDAEQHDHLYMRWKEYFLVPDHRVKSIAGASFEGFYYICFNKKSGYINGIYFHAKSERWQELKLKHVDTRGCVPAMEFR